MTISKRQRQQVRNNPYVGLTGALNRAKQAPKSAPQPAPTPARPTPQQENLGVAGGSMQPAPDKMEDLGVSGPPETKEQPKEELGVSGVKEESKEVGVGTTFQQISQTPRLLLKMRKEPRRMFQNPTWNSIVGIVSDDGQFYNTQTTYAEWYAGLAIAAMFDDLVIYWGPITRGAFPNIWPQGPAQAIAEAKAAGVQMGAHGLINPGKELLIWMINGKVRKWVQGYCFISYQEWQI